MFMESFIQNVLKRLPKTVRKTWKKGKEKVKKNQRSRVAGSESADHRERSTIEIGGCH